MNQEAELLARINELEVENAELKGRVLVAEKQVADAKTAVGGYIAELQRIGPATKELIKNMGIIQDQAMAVRQRLARVLTAWVLADTILSALGKRVHLHAAGQDTWEVEKELESLNERYAQAKREVEKTNAASDQPEGQPVG